MTIKISFDSLREMKLRDICKLEEEYFELLKIRERGLNNNQRIRNGEIKQESAEDLIMGLK